MREIYQIEKTDEPREHEAVDELPPGKQMQVDWGQTIQKTTIIRTSNFILLPLYWLILGKSIWNGKTALLLHRIPFVVMKMPFDYFGGMTEEIVYDQDNLIAVMKMQEILS